MKKGYWIRAHRATADPQKHSANVNLSIPATSDRIKKLDLARTEFHNEDFTTFLTRNYENRLLFLDPPYYLQKASKLYGKNGDMHESFDHEGLFKVLDNTSNWVLCYNDCPYIRKLYTEYTIIAVDWSYGMNKTKKSSEILILCF